MSETEVGVDLKVRKDFLEQAKNKPNVEKYSFGDVSEIVELLSKGANVSKFNEFDGSEYLTELQSSGGGVVRIFRHKYPWSFSVNTKYDKEDKKVDVTKNSEYRLGFTQILNEMQEGAGLA